MECMAPVSLPRLGSASQAAVPVSQGEPLKHWEHSVGAVLKVCCLHTVESALTCSPGILEQTDCALKAYPVLQTTKESDDTLNEGGIKCPKNLLITPKMFSFSSVLSKIVPTYLYSSTSSTFLLWTVLMAAAASSLSLLVKVTTISWSSPCLTPGPNYHTTPQTSAALSCGDVRGLRTRTGELCQMTVWMGGPAVIGVKAEEQRRGDTAWRCACAGDWDVGQGVIDPHPLNCWSVWYDN